LILHVTSLWWCPPAPPAAQIRLRLLSIGERAVGLSSRALASPVMRLTARSLLLVAVAAVVALSPSACGKDKKGGGNAAGSFGTKPSVSVPSKAPAALEKTDLIVGNGAEATAGKSVTVQYVGVSVSTKKQFDASWDRGRPFSFVLGQGNVIQGWDEGVPGMKVGGRRQLVIPADLAYGPSGSPPVIGPNEALVFVVDLLSVK
jgi:peptidylprolyl isomerase